MKRKSEWKGKTTLYDENDDAPHHRRSSIVKDCRHRCRLKNTFLSQNERD